MNPLRISLWQTDLIWEDKYENLRRLRERLETLRGTTEIVVLPEMFSTGFSMNPAAWAEPTKGETLSTLRLWANEMGVALTGSYIACDSPTNTTPPRYYNRAFFLTPEGKAFYYDKHHLFRMGGEAKAYTPGQGRTLIHYRGWNILLLVCYDLRFPVWSRNRKNEYDLLVYVANWPASRRAVWDVLLQARAIENISYVCGVNRIGKDFHGTAHNGGSAVYSPKGKLLASLPDDTEGMVTTVLDGEALLHFREKFPAWKDADDFTLNIR